MRWRAIVLWVLGISVIGVSPARAAEAASDPQLKARVEQIIAELSDRKQAVREKADVKLRNLPLPAYPIVTTIYAREKEALGAEAQSRIDSSIEMFKALAAIDQREHQYWAWMKTNLLQAYDHGSSRDKKWDQPAREAIALATTWSPDAAQSERMRVCFAKAFEAGCDDPLFLYHYANFYSSQGGADERKTLDYIREAVTRASDSDTYPAWVKCLIACRMDAIFQQRLDLKNTEMARADAKFVDAFEFFEEINPQENLPDRLLYEMADVISRESGAVGAKYWYEKVAKPFALCASEPVYLQILKARCDALDANNRDDGADQLRDQRLASAQAAMEKAYAMDRQLSIIPGEMLRILVMRWTNRDEIEKWFQRALAVNPDDFQACTIMLEALPDKEKLDFGRKCLAGQNWRGRIPIILALAHEAVGDAVNDKNAYWQQPQVWNDIKEVYETYLALYSDSVEDRSNYAMLANRCRRWDQADRQFTILGEKPSLRVFGSMTSYNYQRKKAAKNAMQ